MNNNIPEYQNSSTPEAVLTKKLPYSPPTVTVIQLNEESIEGGINELTEAQAGVGLVS